MTNRNILKFQNAIFQRWVHAKSNQHWKSLSKTISETPCNKEIAPVIFFNASTRLQAMSQNAAYSYITLQALRLQGIPVIQFACKAGLSRCVLGSNRDDVGQVPPCAKCITQSRAVFQDVPTHWFEFKADEAVAGGIESLSLEQLCEYTFQEAPLGFWAVNSLRWVLRRHHLTDDAATKTFLKHFILSAWNVVKNFTLLADEVHPQAAVIFNGMFYPEAAVRYVCQKQKIKVITHEVGLRPYTAFFTTGEATAYPIHIDSSFQLSDEMNTRLDKYLSDRFQGNFSMAGIRFWPEMKGLDDSFLKKASEFKQLVPIFTNVIFDTSQVHANTLFEEMFLWLDHVKEVIEKHPETLFVIRAHPDELREGKASRESVGGWVKKNHVAGLSNVVFVDSKEFISSYDLIQRSHFVMVYNSTIGLEASLMGKAVLAGGKARFTQMNTAFLPANRQEYDRMLEKFLTEPSIKIPEEFHNNARRFLYYQLYVSSLPFDQFLKEDGIWKGYVNLKEFPLETLLAENSKTIQVLSDGILHSKPFEMPL